jgi:DNA modification methylase/ParB-like chromosome segregation protein Spo0J
MPPPRAVDVPVDLLRPHPQAGLVPPLSDEEAQALRDDIERRGIQVPLCATPEGVVLCGHHRLRLALELGLRGVPVIRRDGLSPAAQVEHMVLDNVHRRHMTPSQRAALLTAPRIAEALGKALAEDARRRRIEGNRLGGASKSKSRAALPVTSATRVRDVLGQVGGVSGRLIDYAREAWAHAPDRTRALVEGRSKETVSQIAQDARIEARKAAQRAKAPRRVIDMRAGLRNRLHIGDALHVLRALPADSIHCCVTSPPYWGLRDYEADGQLGVEETPEEYVSRLVDVFREVRRVLHPSGTCWLVLGDTYAADRPMQVPSTKGGRKIGSAQGTSGPMRVPEGLKAKDLIGIPWRVAFALQADGWWLRTENIWHKGSVMPESVTDRTTRCHEHVFMLAKNERYFYDGDAIREPYATPAGADDRQDGNLSGRNKRSVWAISPKPYKGAHFAVFPPELPEICIKAGTSEMGACEACGAPRTRVVERPIPSDPGRSASSKLRDGAASPDRSSLAARTALRRLGAAYQKQLAANPPVTIRWDPTCDCNAGEPVPCLVLDPFAGSGTTLAVAKGLGRDHLGIELNPAYKKLIDARIKAATDPRRRRAERAG